MCALAWWSNQPAGSLRVGPTVLAPGLVAVSCKACDGSVFELPHGLLCWPVHDACVPGAFTLFWVGACLELMCRRGVLLQPLQQHAVLLQWLGRGLQTWHSILGRLCAVVGQYKGS